MIEDTTILFRKRGDMMKIVGVIPARYASTRFPGKPLVDIMGKPMIWWVYQQVKKEKGLADVFVATDDSRISSVCALYNIPVIMTRNTHQTHLDRLAEFADNVDADFYVNINGDEPLIDSAYIAIMFPHPETDPKSFYAANAMTKIKRPVEAVDFARIKVVVDIFSNCLYLSRSAIPYPKGGDEFQYNKFVGIQCFSKSALDFCAKTPRGFLESIEDIDEFRFIENGQKLKFISIGDDVTILSIDTPKDLEKVRTIIQKKIDSGELQSPPW
jgi:3-deoxy-manno-octulosonate cytidylyltransferase (CMP-KDO synthetase)